MRRGRPPFSARPPALRGAERQRLKVTIAQTRQNPAFRVEDKIWSGPIEERTRL